MPDYKRTEELFKAEGILHLYKKPPGQLDEELFYAKVTNPETNTFYQIPDLPLEYRKNLQQNKTYPVREVYQIYRIKRLDGTEWLKTTLLGSQTISSMVLNIIQTSMTAQKQFTGGSKTC